MEINFNRNQSYNNKILIIDGQPGCGKTLFSQICSSFKRMEMFSFAFELEFIIKLYNFKKIEKNATATLVKMLVDHKIYQNMMGREVNFRYKDLSSVFNYPYPIEYLRRILSKGDEHIPLIIKKAKPILNLTTHDIMRYSDILFQSLGKRLVFFEIIRHPLYMVIQQEINEKELNNNVRDIQLRYNFNKQNIPYYSFEIKKEYVKSNSMDRAILTIKNFTEQNKFMRKKLLKKGHNILTIPFERFVLKPDIFLKKMLVSLGTEFGKKTYKILKKNNIPRSRIEDGIDLDIYRRYGWTPSLKDSSFEKEKNKRIKYIINKGGSKKNIDLIFELSKEYEKNYYWF